MGVTGGVRVRCVLSPSRAFWHRRVTPINRFLPLSFLNASITTTATYLNMGTEKILPKEGQRNILITSALPYVNNVSPRPLTPYHD